jgi:hypothetical protein
VESPIALACVPSAFAMFDDHGGFDLLERGVGMPNLVAGMDRQSDSYWASHMY